MDGLTEKRLFSITKRSFLNNTDSKVSFAAVILVITQQGFSPICLMIKITTAKILKNLYQFVHI